MISEGSISKMVLSYSELYEKANKRNKDFNDLEKEHFNYLMHVNGVGLLSYLEKIEGFENEQQKELRAKYTRSNRSLFSSLLNPINKVFTAQGGSDRNQFKLENHTKEFAEITSNISEGMSLKKWTQIYWRDKLIVDPNGLFFVEHDEKDCYPTYKSIATIQEYEAKGQGLNWVIFKPFEVKELKYFRYYDYSGDYLFQLNDENITLIEDKSFENSFENDNGFYVPGFIISDIVNTLTGFRESPISKEVEISKEVLLTGSIKNIYKLKQGFPLTWMYEKACNKCQGTGEINGQDCDSCKGTGGDNSKDISDIRVLSIPVDNDSPKLDPIAGFISPDIAYLDYVNKELEYLKNELESCQWGTTRIKEKEKTATEVWVNVQPITEKLHQYKDGIQASERKLNTIIANFYFDDFEGSYIFYGTRYMIESPDQLLKRKIEAKEKGIDIVTQNYLNNQYYSTEFANDPLLLQEKQKLHKLEPFPYNSLEEIERSQIISIEDKKKKAYFGEWINTLDETEIFSKTLEELEKLLIIYINTKKYEVQGNL
ncbi:MAG: hypothetical protein GY870_03920 [archaeon]|nr:hypothetical protein [archaeon]